jgi:pimeloyl-ACP methyl ester carboxylesterase
MAVDHGDVGYWKSTKSEREYLDLYAAVREEAWEALCERGWSGAPEERDVETRFGATHVFHWAGAGVPIVLLHGAGTSSVMWAPLIAELVGFSVYAFDGIGEPGLTVQTAAVRDRGDLVAWLDDVLDGLGLDQVHLVGSSYGGWIALNAALQSSRRVATLTLLEPVLTRLRPYFWVHALSVAAAFALPTRIRRSALRRLHMDLASEGGPRLVRFGRLGLMKYRRRVPRPVPVTDDEFASVITPTLLLLGDKSEIHHSKSLLAKAQRAMPNMGGALVADTGHSLPLDRAEAIAPRFRSFVATPHDTASP